MTHLEARNQDLSEALDQCEAEAEFQVCRREWAENTLVRFLRIISACSDQLDRALRSMPLCDERLRVATAYDKLRALIWDDDEVFQFAARRGMELNNENANAARKV